mmetsp:Transcript_5336/g.15495  ORF Transcript_5336/g.15495 Transcript_5336/m.15495 type:complete len:432 (+) Transcript_5336:162-1457(+)
MIRMNVTSLVQRHFAPKNGTNRVVSAASSALSDWKTEKESERQQQRARLSSYAMDHSHVKVFGGSMVANTPTSQRRFMSTNESSGAASAGTTSPPSSDQAGNFEETMDKIFTQSQQVAASEGDKWFVDEALTQEVWDPKWWNFADQAVNAVNFVNDTTGLGVAGSVFAVTCAIRAVILPLAIRGQRASSRMAHLQPELAMLKKRYEALGTPSQAEQQAFAKNMQALFKRYEVTPFSALATPLIQAPMFIGMFFGMRKLPDLFPEACANGGLWWFTDLTVADPTYILPIACGISFVATIESGKDQMIDSNPQHGPVIVNAFRAMAVVMIPVITTFPAAMLCYWVPNNFITMVQSITLRNDWVKQQFGIWDRPKPLPGQATDAGFQETMEKLVKQVKGEPTTEKEKIERHNKEIETRKRVQQASKTARASRRG